ncbi:MAG: hypothetical protein ACI4IW_02265 [Oscillospiraceae bacterium]
MNKEEQSGFSAVLLPQVSSRRKFPGVEKQSRHIGTALRILLLAVLIASGALFSSCSKNPEMYVKLVNLSDGSTVTVSDGSEQMYFSVGEGESCEVLVTVERESGALSLSILKERSGEKIYSGKDIPTSRFSVIADEAGDYIIKIEAESFIGSYELEYSYTEG